MVDPPFHHLRRHSLLPSVCDRLSEGVVIVTGERTVVEVYGGPPLATIELFAGGESVGVIPLDELGAGMAQLTDMEIPAGVDRIPLVLRHGGRLVLQGTVPAPAPHHLVVGEQQ